MADTGLLDREVAGRRYAVFVPRDVPRPMPAILFLHGRGECGTDGLKQAAVGLVHRLMFRRERWPFLVIAPQKADSDALWLDDKPYVESVLDVVEAEFNPDPHRRYITGLSQGGRGTFDLASRLRWDFAAAAPVCGWSDLERVGQDLKDIPTWAFHGTDDGVIPVERSVEAVEAIQAAGGEARLTTYDGVGHNAWDPAYDEPDLPTWFLSHTHA